MAHFTIRTDTHMFSMNDQPDAKIVERAGGIIVVKVPGHTERHGVSISTYKPAEYQVWQITEITDSGLLMHGQAHWIVDFPVNSKLQGKYLQHHTSTDASYINGNRG